MTELRSSFFSKMRNEPACGCSPRWSNTCRKPSVIAVSATSLVLTPNFAHTASTAARGTRTVWYRRMVAAGLVDVWETDHIADVRVLVRLRGTAVARHN